jgi:hypothetical protein
MGMGRPPFFFTPFPFKLRISEMGFGIVDGDGTPAGFFFPVSFQAAHQWDGFRES